MVDAALNSDGGAGASDAAASPPLPSTGDTSKLQASYDAHVLASYRRLASDFDAAYRAHPEIPRGVLEAVSFSRTGFAAPAAPASSEELVVYGPMGLKEGDGRSFRDVLGLVSAQSGIARDELRTDPRANIAGYAAAFAKLRADLGVSGQAVADHVPVLRALGPHVDDALGRQLEAIYLHSVLSFLEKYGAEQGFPWERAQFDYGAILGERMGALVTASTITLVDGELVAGEPQVGRLAPSLAVEGTVPELLAIDPDPYPLLPIDPDPYPLLPIDPIDPVDSDPEPIPPRPPVNLSAPVITGTLQVEQTLTATNGTWSGTTPMSFGRQWQRCNQDGSGCAAIAGATASTYKLTPNELNANIQIAVTASNGGGSATGTSTLTAAIGHVCGRDCGYPPGIIWSPGHPSRLRSATQRACSAVTGIAIHHTADPSFDNVLRGWASAGAAAAPYLVGQDGKIAQAYGELDVVSHSVAYSDRTIGIETVNTGFQPYPPDQLFKTAWLTRGIACRYNIDPTTTYRGFGTDEDTPYRLSACLRIKGHGHWDRGRWDPGPNWDWWKFYELVTDVNPWRLVNPNIEEHDGCGGIVTDHGGDTRPYPNNEFYHIRLTAPSSADRIEVTFQQWSLRAGEWMHIYDGPDNRAPGIGSWSHLMPRHPASARAGTLRSSGNTLSMYFSSDCADQASGFRFVWYSVRPDGTHYCCFDPKRRVVVQSSASGSDVIAGDIAADIGGGFEAAAADSDCEGDTCEVPCEVECAEPPPEADLPFCGDGTCAADEDCTCLDCACLEGETCTGGSENASCATCTREDTDDEPCCDGLQCGLDPCGTGQSCGTCPPGEFCENTFCRPTQQACCGTRNCGPDPCGTGVSCGTCPPLPPGDEGSMRCSETFDEGVEPGHCVCTNTFVGEPGRCRAYRACDRQERQQCDPGFVCNVSTEQCEPEDCECCDNPDPCCGVECGAGYECQDGLCVPEGCTCNCDGGCECSPGASAECCSSCCDSCPDDGGYCGDGECDYSAYEDIECCDDCGTCGGYCGDGQCDYAAYEDIECCDDCGTCGGGGYCGDGSCDYWAYEDIDCCWDCGTCGGGGGGDGDGGDGCDDDPWDDWDDWDDEFDIECPFEN